MFATLTTGYIELHGDIVDLGLEIAVTELEPSVYHLVALSDRHNFK